jgi:hypothetical protein
MMAALVVCPSHAEAEAVDERVIVEQFFEVCAAQPVSEASMAQAAVENGFSPAPPGLQTSFQNELADRDLLAAFTMVDGRSVPVLLLITAEEVFDSPHLVCAFELFLGDADSALGELQTRTDRESPYDWEEVEGRIIKRWAANSIVDQARIFFADRGDLSGFTISLTVPYPN